MIDLLSLKEQAEQLTAELCEIAQLSRDDLMVVGCSTSEILGERIGRQSSLDVGTAMVTGILSVLRAKGIGLAAQTCEHLNRSLIVERRFATKDDIVNVVPQPKAGGSFATAFWQAANDPVAVERVAADAGLDVGDTLIGMHIRRVAIPVRLSTATVGLAHLTAARSRPPVIGGSRASFDERMG